MCRLAELLSVSAPDNSHTLHFPQEPLPAQGASIGIPARCATASNDSPAKETALTAASPPSTRNTIFIAFVVLAAIVS
jgi:hypothetical protein